MYGGEKQDSKGKQETWYEMGGGGAPWHSTGEAEGGTRIQF